MSLKLNLNLISPIDGRYEKYTQGLAPYFSEAAFMKYRVMVEGEYLIALSGLKTKLRKITPKEIKLIRSICDLTDADALLISQIETKGYKNIKATDHDTKAVEYFIKEKLADTSLKNVLEWIHFGLTSEDTINLAYALMISDALEAIIEPRINKIKEELEILVKKYKDSPMLARTHGQSASPTTFGKEMRVFVARLERRLVGLASIKIQAKLNGATGNYNAHFVAYPNIDWPVFSIKFIESFNKDRKYKLEANLFTTQIECHDSYIAIFDTVRRINTILIGLNQDLWRYISSDLIGQKPIGDVGSSTMPHKINPIKFENSEGNLGMANAVFEFFARKLPISRLQRDLSDSTVVRNIGSAFAHSLIAYEYMIKGLSSIKVNEAKMLEELNNHPEVIAEAIQTILRREGLPMPYEKLKDLTRGKQVTLSDIHKFITDLDVTDQIKKELLRLTPENYTGLASKLASR